MLRQAIKDHGLLDRDCFKFVAKTLLFKVERMRKAILECLEVEFAMPPIPLVTGVVGNWGARGGRGRGARLEIAGVVVGQWSGGSYPRTPRYPQVTIHSLA